MFKDDVGSGSIASKRDLIECHEKLINQGPGQMFVKLLIPINVRQWIVSVVLWCLCIFHKLSD